jgi:hypothetical protein
MRSLLRVLPALVVMGLGAYAVGGFAREVRAAGAPVNACGCYRDTSGSCFCGKKSKCDCPGDCEPKGCEEKRAKEIEKEVELETRRAREIEKKQRDEEAEKQRRAEAAANEEEGASGASGADSSEVQTGGSGGEQGQGASKVKKTKRTKKSKKSTQDN